MTPQLYGVLVQPSVFQNISGNLYPVQGIVIQVGSSVTGIPTGSTVTLACGQGQTVLSGSSELLLFYQQDILV